MVAASLFRSATSLMYFVNASVMHKINFLHLSDVLRGHKDQHGCIGLALSVVAEKKEDQVVNGGLDDSFGNSDKI